jgi:hypothetical protein
MKQTAVKLLFEEFKALSKSMRDAGDVSSANLIDFLCEREQVALEMEKQQIIDACNQKEFGDIDGMGIHETITKGEQYYEQTYAVDAGDGKAD